MRMSTRSAASRFDNGSSKRKTCGLRTIDRPIATRCRCPPESWLGLRSSRCSICRMRAASSTAAFFSAFGTPASVRPKPMFSPTVMCGKIA